MRMFLENKNADIFSVIFRLKSSYNVIVRDNCLGQY